MELSDAIIIHGESSEGNSCLGQGAAGTVKVYEYALKGKVARKTIVSKSCYYREKHFLGMCIALKSEMLYKFVIDCVAYFHKSDNLFIIDFELAETDLHKVAVNANDAPTGCGQ
jgi:hypothetical protein